MASNTPNLDLLKKDPITDGNDTFNIQTMLNDNWDKIDTAVGEVREELANIDIPLSDATSGNRSDVAASEKAVGQVMSAAQAAQTTANAANLAATAAETPTGAQNKVDTHANLTAAHGATSAATANRIMMRDPAGRSKVAAPAAADDVARKDTVDNAVGTLSSLLTTTKSNAVAAINELFTSVSDGKTAVAAAITGKGVAASGSDTFAVLAQKIGQIVTGKRFATGTVQSDNTGTFSVSGIEFTPGILIYADASQASYYGVVIKDIPNGLTVGRTLRIQGTAAFTGTEAVFTSNGVTGVKTNRGNVASFDWLAIE